MQDFCLNILERGDIWSKDLYFCYNWPLKNLLNAPLKGVFMSDLQFCRASLGKSEA
jgi:hypothetical protein